MNRNDMERVKALVRNIPDFPVKGIQFKDLTTAFKDAAALTCMADTLADIYRGRGVTKVAGIESRGFIGGALLAAKLGAGFVPIRKPGKLPADTVSMSYDKEYGTDTIEMHSDAITPDDVVVIHDDLLATGGTMLAAYKLVQMMQPKAIYINFLCTLRGLNGRDLLPADVEVTSLFDFDGK
ncbi:MAG: adenine phosphoribosyltransferase [Muribaculaceae bacterium]|nr:adenine phosphoribosyltransferase [Muribaculaceae bacterium]